MPNTILNDHRYRQQAEFCDRSVERFAMEELVLRGTNGKFRQFELVEHLAVIAALIRDAVSQLLAQEESEREVEVPMISDKIQ